MAKPNKRKVKYSGVLAAPMQFYRYPRETLVGGPVPEETWRAKQGEAEAKNLDQFLERVVALFMHYDVPAGDFTTLALKLAWAHVPGFRFRSPGERTRGRASGTAKEILERVEQFREILPLADKLGVKRACEILSKRTESHCYGVKPVTLRKMMTDAKRARVDEPNGFALVMARFAVDNGIVGPLPEDDTGTHTPSEFETPQRVRKK